MFAKIKTVLDSILKWVLVAIMSVMTINVLWQVFSRFILSKPSSITEELARYSLVWLGILGASYVAGQKLHLAIDLLLIKLKGNAKSYLEIFIQVCIFVFAFSVMFIGGIRLVTITLTLNQISAALQVPLGYVYLVLPISGLVIAFYSIHFIIEEVKKIRTAQNF
jgi:TRAP-type C4-dicarboxylate transport system permease small subunit